jgi:hypothetical protein
MFIPVPIKAKYFVPVLVLVDLYLGVSGQSILVEAVSHILLTLEVLYFLIMWYWKKNQFNDNGTKQFRLGVYYPKKTKDKE